MASFKKIRDLGDFSDPPATGDYLPVATHSGPQETKKSTIKDVIDSYNTEKTKEALEAAGADPDALNNPSTELEVDPDEGGGVQVKYDPTKGKCVVENDPPLTIGNFRQLIDPLGGLQLTPIYGAADSNGCRNYTYQLGVSTGGSSATEFVLLLGKHPVLDVKYKATQQTTIRGDNLHGNDPEDNNGTIGTDGKVFDNNPTTTSFITNLVAEDTDIYNGRQLLMQSGATAGERVTISAYDASTKKLTFSALSAVPANDDTFTIIASLSYQATIDDKLDTGFILRGVDKTTDGLLNNGADIIFDDNSWKESSGGTIGWPKEIYSDNWKTKRTTVKLKGLMEYSPTPINRGNPHEYAPSISPITYNSIAAPYHALTLVDYSGEKYLAHKTIPAGGVIPFDGNNVNTEYWTKVDNNRPWSFNQIVIHNGTYYISKNPGGSGIDPANTDDWHSLGPNPNEPEIDQMANTRSSAYYYNRHQYASGGYEKNVVLQPFISWQGLIRYVARYLTGATRIIVLLRDPELKCKLSDHFYAAYRTGLRGSSVMQHVQLNIPDGAMDFSSPISGKPRILECDTAFACTGGNASVAERDFDIYFWLRLGANAYSNIQNIHFKFPNVTVGGPHFNITRFDSGGGSIGECIWDFSGTTGPTSTFDVLVFYSDPGGQQWNFNSVYSPNAYRTRGPNGTINTQSLMQINNDGTYEDVNFFPVASDEPIKFAHEVHGNNNVNIGTLVVLQNDAKLRHFYWTHTNFGYWDANNSGWRNLMAGANSSTRFMTDMNNVSLYFYQNKTTEVFFSSTACQATDAINLGAMKGLTIDGVGWVMYHANGVAGQSAYQNNKLPASAMRDPATWPMPVPATQGNQKIITSSTKTRNEYGELNIAADISYYYPYSAFPRGNTAPAAAYNYVPTAMGMLFGTSLDGGNSFNGSPGIEFNSSMINSVISTKLVMKPDYTANDQAFVQSNSDTLVYTTAQIPPINNHTAYAAS